MRGRSIAFIHPIIEASASAPTVLLDWTVALIKKECRICTCGNHFRHLFYMALTAGMYQGIRTFFTEISLSTTRA